MASIVAPRSKPLVYLRKERQDNWSGAGFGAANSTRVLLSCRPGSQSEVYDVTNGKILSRSTRLKGHPCARPGVMRASAVPLHTRLLPLHHHQSRQVLLL